MPRKKVIYSWLEITEFGIKKVLSEEQSLMKAYYCSVVWMCSAYRTRRRHQPYLWFWLWTLYDMTENRIINIPAFQRVAPHYLQGKIVFTWFVMFIFSNTIRYNHVVIFELSMCPGHSSRLTAMTILQLDIIVTQKSFSHRFLEKIIENSWTGWHFLYVYGHFRNPTSNIGKAFVINLVIKHHDNKT